MKALLTAIKSRVQSDLSYVRDSDVFVVEDESAYPGEATRFPAVGLKDGPVVRRELAGGMMEYTMTVKVILFVQLSKPEATIMGDAATGRVGILDMEADVHESLDENLLGISGMQSAVALPEQPESELFGDEKEMLQRKMVSYEYIKETERPSAS